MKRAIVFLWLWVGSHKVAVAAGLASGASAFISGLDPLRWGLSAFGMAVVWAYFPATTRSKTLVNAGISLVLGGVVAPWCAVAVGVYVNPKLSNDYVTAFFLSASWPWLIQYGIPAVTGWLKRKVEA